MFQYVHNTPLRPVIEESRLKCPLETREPVLDFSLEDYRNELFESNDPNRIIEFYSSFNSRQQLLRWMEKRPKGVTTIFEVEGDDEIVVVIPTAEFNGENATRCRQEIFKGFRTVFVQSGGRSDYYFNYSHNCNVGIKKAMEYSPKWIVLSNDDVYKIDDPDKLRRLILKYDNDKVRILFTEESEYHSKNLTLFQPSYLGKLHTRIMKALVNKKTANNGLGIATSFNVMRATELLAEKFSILHKLRSSASTSIRKKIENTVLYKRMLNGTFFQDFGIFSSELIKDMNGSVFDENFVNGSEDTMLSLELISGEIKAEKIDYRVGDFIGSTLGNGSLRKLRDMAGFIKLDSLIKDAEIGLKQKYGIRQVKSLDFDLFGSL